MKNSMSGTMAETTGTDSARRCTVEPLDRRRLLSVTPLTLATVAASAPQVAVDGAGNIYGTTAASGNNGGTVFQIDATTHAVRTLASFTPSTDGVNPKDILIDAAGNLFGDAGPSATGDASFSDPTTADTLWELPAGASTVKVLDTFDYTGLVGVAATPATALTIDAFDNLYISAIYHDVEGEFPNITEYVASSGTIEPIANAVDNATSHQIQLLGTFATDPAGDAFYGYDTFSPSSSVTLYRAPAGTGQYEAANITDPIGRTNLGNTDAVGPVGLYTQLGMAADAKGDLFVTLPNGEVQEIKADGASSAAATLDGTTLGNAFSGTPVVDNAGDLFSATTAGVVELPAGSSALRLLSSVALTGMTTDAAGNLYGTNPAGSIVELPGAGTAAPRPTPTAPVITPASKLTPAQVNNKVPAVVIATTPINKSVTVAVTNSGTAKITGQDTVSLVAVSTDGTGSTVASAKASPKLKSNQSIKVSLKVKSLSLPAGTYTLLSRVADAAGGVTTAATGQTVTVVAPAVVLSGTVTKVSTAATTPGRTLSFTLIVSNAGNVNSTGAATVAVYLSTDGMALTIPVSTVKVSPTIKAGKSVPLRLKVKVPATAAAMNLYPLAVFAQDGQTAQAAATIKVAVG